jgi:cobalamin biosynthesis protein CobT
MSRAYADYQIKAWQVVEVLAPATTATIVAVPATETQARELSKLLNDHELLRKTWKDLVSSKVNITAAVIKNAVTQALASDKDEDEDEDEDSDEEDDSNDQSEDEDEEEDDSEEDDSKEEEDEKDSSESDEEDTCILPDLTLHEFERGILSSHEFWPWFIRGYSPKVVQDLLSKDDRLGEDRLTKKETLELVRGLAKQLSDYAESLEKSL